MTAFINIWKESLRITTRNKLNSLLAVLILAAGLAGCVFAIGMGTALFSNDGSVIPKTIHVVGEREGTRMGGLRGRDALALRALNLPELNAMSLLRSATFNVRVLKDNEAGAGRGLNIEGVWTDGEIFAALGWRMALGRDFKPADFAASSAGDTAISGGVILADQLWRKEFGARANVLGELLLVDGTPRVIIGVLGPSRAFPNRGQLYVPFRLSADSPLIGRFFNVFAKIAPHQVDAVKIGVAALQARREIDVGAPAKLSPFSVVDFATAGANPETKIVFQMLSIVGWLVLLLAGVNVGGLLLVHWLSRTHEIATRSALGSSKARLAGAALMQATILVLLALALTLAGLHVSMPMFEEFLHTSPNAGVPIYMHFNLKLGMLFPMLLACLVAIAAIAAPVLWHLRESNLMRELRGTERGNSGAGKLGLTLLVAQCLLSVSAVLIAVMCAQGATAAMQRDYGIHAPRVLVAQIRSSDQTAQIQAGQALFAQLKSHPEIELASASMGIPQIFQPNAELVVGMERIGVNFTPADVNFAEVYGIKMRAGRWLLDTDIGKDVAVIDPATAAKAFAGQDALGQELSYFGIDGKTKRRAVVIGITEPVALDLEQGPDKPSMFVPMQWNETLGVCFSVRTRAQNERSFLPTFEQLGNAADARIALFNLRTYREAFAAAGGGYRLLSALFAPMGVLALVLTAVGLAALLGSLVAKRMRQSAIRRALGASTSGVLIPLLRPLLLAAALGLGVGTAFALPLAFQMSKLIYEGQYLSAATIIVTLLIVICALALACITPARRALRANPNLILKQE
jgi:putative ABC transport system permease protein